MAIQIHDPYILLHKRGGEIVVFVESNQDLTASDYQYFGYINSDGTGWLIQRFHIQSSTVIYEYAAGQSVAAYLTHWNGTTGAFVSGGLTFQRIDQVLTP